MHKDAICETWNQVESWARENSRVIFWIIGVVAILLLPNFIGKSPKQAIEVPVMATHKVDLEYRVADGNGNWVHAYEFTPKGNRNKKCVLILRRFSDGVGLDCFDK